MTQGEKARAYDEIVGKLKVFMAQGVDPLMTRADVQDFFPELAESEDEKFRKYILKCCEETISADDRGLELSMDTTFKLKNWLERQCKQKPQGKTALEALEEIEANNANCATPLVEPPFKVGDWIVNNNSKDVFLIKSFNSGYCTLENIKGNIISPCLPSCESESHLWTIADAKDGDVLVASDRSIFLFAGVVDCACKYYVALTTCNDIKINKEVEGGYWETSRAVHPATEEQRDLLFWKMREVGYEWNAEKKELKKRRNEYDNR